MCDHRIGYRYRPTERLPHFIYSSDQDFCATKRPKPEFFNFCPDCGKQLKIKPEKGGDKRG